MIFSFGQVLYSTMIQMGIVMGVQPPLSYNYGAKDKARMKEILQKLTFLTCGVGLAATPNYLDVKTPAPAVFMHRSGCVL